MSQGDASVFEISGLNTNLEREICMCDTRDLITECCACFNNFQYNCVNIECFQQLYWSCQLQLDILAEYAPRLRLVCIVVHDAFQKQRIVNVMLCRVWQTML